MGLDMFLYRASKIEGLNPGDTITRSEFNKKYIDGVAIPSDSKSAKLRTVKRMGTPVKIVEKVYDAALVGEACGYRNVKSISKYHEQFGKTHTISFFCYDENGNKVADVTLNDNEEKKVLVGKDFDYIVLNLKNIDYQRKGLNEKGWSLLPDNCEYYDGKTRIRKMTQCGGLSKSFIENWNDGETLFEAWW